MAGQREREEREEGKRRRIAEENVEEGKELRVQGDKNEKPVEKGDAAEKDGANHE